MTSMGEGQHAGLPGYRGRGALRGVGYNHSLLDPADMMALMGAEHYAGPQCSGCIAALRGERHHRRPLGPTGKAPQRAGEHHAKLPWPAGTVTLRGAGHHTGIPGPRGGAVSRAGGNHICWPGPRSTTLGPTGEVVSKGVARVLEMVWPLGKEASLLGQGDGAALRGAGHYVSPLDPGCGVSLRG